MAYPELTSFQAEIVRTTPRAYLLKLESQEGNIWIPASQVEQFDFNYDPPKISIPYWLAKDKGIV